MNEISAGLTKTGSLQKIVPGAAMGSDSLPGAIFLTSFQKTKSVPLMIMTAERRIFRMSDRLRIVSVVFLGGCLMASLSTGSTPKLFPSPREKDMSLLFLMN